MYKVFINEKPLFFLSTLEGVSVSQGSGIIEYDSILDIDDIFDYHDHNMSTFVLGDLSDWKAFQELFCPIEAAGGLVRKNDQYLFIFRNGKWDLPKGKIDPGETPETAAVREVEEECGIDSPDIVDNITETYHTYFLEGKWILKRTHWFLMEYSGDQALTPQLEEGITKADWLTREKWNQVMNNTYGSIQDVLDLCS